MDVINDDINGITKTYSYLSKSNIESPPLLNLNKEYNNYENQRRKTTLNFF